MQAIELLAPAGNVEIGRSAILSGADAIYIGPSSFGARKSASNSMDEIARLLEFAHLFDVKVYLTMNTILYDEELEKAESIARRAEELGVDALIVQDMAYLKMGLGRIPLHASTQTFNFDLDKIKLVASSGFDRLVLERSLTLDEIKLIREEISPAVELETFVHGAMCVGMSGRCYLSQALCSRSGNRGVCAQPCRTTYNVIDEKSGKFLSKSATSLSVGDLDFSDRLKQLAGVGVCSFKIEGRLKDESYVVNTVSYYNQLFDSLGFDRTSKGRGRPSFSPNPKKIFFRGDSGHMFLDNSRAKVGAPTKSLGEKIGIVSDIKNGEKIEIKNCSIEIHTGDGLSWIGNNNLTQYGAFVNKVYSSELISLSSYNGLHPGIEIYRNLDKKFHPTWKNVSRKIPIHIKISSLSDKLIVSADGLSMKFPYDFPVADNSSLAEKNIISSFSKCGDSPFEVSSISVELKCIPFIPVSTLNEMRREFLSGYSTWLLKNYSFTKRKNTVSPTLRFPKSLSFEWNVSNSMARKFYMEHGSLEIEQALELQNNIVGKTVMVSRHCIRRQMGLCPKDNPSIVSASPLILENNGRQLRAIFDCNACLMKLILLK